MPTYNDRPVRKLQDDALNFADYAPALKSIITTGDTPLTLGVFLRISASGAQRKRTSE